jgi:hypothetical protein
MSTVQNGVPLDVNGAVVVSALLLAMLVLRGYGTDAHLYLPGVGYVNGVDAGNYLDTAFAPTAQDQPVGLVVDSLGAINASNNTTAQKPILRRVPILGPELVVSPYSGLVTGAWTITSTSVLRNGETFNTAKLNLSASISTVKKYAVTFSVAGFSGDNTNMKLGDGGPSIGLITRNGDYTLNFVAGGGSANSISFFPWAGTVGQATITNVSVREIIGYTNQWYWEFVSPDRLILSALPFVATDDYCVGVAVNAPATGALQTVFEVGSGAYARACSIRHSGIGWQCVWADATAVVLPSSTPAKSGPVVVSVRKIGNVVSMVEDGTINRGSAAPPGGATAMTQAVIGARSSNADFLTGGLFAQYIIKGTVPDADRLTLDRMLAGLQGRVLP